ncbi:AAA ATPase domain protein [uncultured archaeon]|nr:AAA ATPase domain protein [uncultured archaeon]
MNTGIFSIKANDFGPLNHLDIDIKPLTIFIGPNNSGKSYTAMLIYSILKANQNFLGYIVSPFYRSYRVPTRAMLHYNRFIQMRLQEGTEDFYKVETGKLENKIISEWMDTVSKEIEDKKKDIIEFSAFPNDLKKLFYEILIGDFKDRFEKIISTTFASTLKELERFGSKKAINFYFKSKMLSYSFRLYKGELFLESFFCDDIEKLIFVIERGEKNNISTKKNKIFICVKDGKIDKKNLLNNILGILFEKWGKAMNNFLEATDINYLPAARSGLLQGHKVLAASFVEMASMAGIKPMNIPALSGVVSDFIVKLFQYEMRRRQGDFDDIATFIEKEMINGSIRVDYDKHSYPEISYVVSNSRIPLHKTSSMVSEIAPFVLYLRHIIQKNSFLIIEEPEAHLHPDIQRIFARVIARLVRKGVKVIITTHSDILLQQLNNQIFMSNLNENDLIESGYSREDCLVSSEVGAYLFRYSDKIDGAVSEKIEIDENGISDEEFAIIIDKLYNQTANLRQKIK